jgi:ubiquinone/menaquinone biosynthesis C-methylase UbiE
MNEAKSMTDQEKMIRDQEETRTSHWLLSRRGPAFLSPLIRMFSHSLKLVSPFIESGQVVAELGCGWGHDAFSLAEMVGSKGKVYAVDLGKKPIKSIQKKIEKTGRRNIEAYNASASELSFIPDRSVDFVYANGLLCSMAYYRPQAVEEIKRILKGTGKAYLSLGMTPPMGYVDQVEWEKIMKGFNILKGGSYKELWAIVEKQGIL